FSEPVYEGGTVLLVRDAAAAADRPGLLDELVSSFRSTFVEEQRWEMILRGLGVTLLISLCSVLSGTLLAMLVCALRRSRLRALSLPAQLYIALMRGTPIVVVLLILYYVVFQGLSIDPVPIAILGFALNFAAYSAETFRSGVSAIDPGQVEAAQAMGFSRLQIFFCITLPQATRHALPVYKGDVISTVKSTSVVGYIAILDLTKMSDLIRSRTYEAFFPLLTTALIYLALANIIAALIGLVERRIDPQRRRVSLDFLRETDSRSS
ncbi:MAG: amino acid ABC transporter permease, partial [Akkermansia sp.]